MLSRVLWAVAVILLIFALLGFLKVLVLGVGWIALLIVGIVLGAIAWAIGTGFYNRAP